ncbi:MAG: hypothetical protein KF730_09580 [Sphingomonas sp.]|uniref:hypothetical protein n=1 Tax=Sphingomonas sp. TaxID=28214 RepID=UPI0025ED2AC6|nr:hypothetical protein [Sphingomonas sp.]MBX3564813.1 hypothetical protein [Sphingomonas sp.]
MRIAQLAVVAVMALSAPANAADLATIDCVIGKVQPALKEQIEGDITRSFTDNTPRPVFDSVVNSGLRSAATACATENKWSEAAATAARDYALAKLGMPIAEKFVSDRGFDVAELETRFGELPEETRNRQLTKEEMQQLVIASVTDEAMQTRENAALLNKYFLMLSTVQFAAWDFSQA